ncbi:MAG: flagellar basal body rod protein FlgB [Azospirillum sp.]|nr:flagellar basal body rod protein FlgB [Azospirillum sp.]
MDLNNLGLFRLLTKKMEYLGQRQQVLAENVANTDTPGYKPRDLQEFSFKTVLAGNRRLAPVQTSASHLTGTAGSPNDQRPERDRRPFETKPDGNAVIVEEQMLKMNRNAGEYSMITNLYRKQIGLLKTALGRPAG